MLGWMFALVEPIIQMACFTQFFGLTSFDKSASYPSNVIKSMQNTINSQTNMYDSYVDLTIYLTIPW